MKANKDNRCLLPVKVIIAVLLCCLVVHAQGQTNQVFSANDDIILHHMLDEVNYYAKRLNLPEPMYITTNNLMAIHISPPDVAKKTGGVGNLHTTNYSYAFGRGRHLTSIIRLAKDKSGRTLYERFKPWQISPSQVNTNQAYQDACIILTNAAIDTKKLADVGASISIRAITILDMTTSVYSIAWKIGQKTVVEVGLDDVKKELWLLRINDTSYITRKALEE
jgi:hypothetical protein